MAEGIKVEALKAHTYNGNSYEVGDTYTFFPVDNPSGISAEDQVASLQSTGFAARVDRVKVAKAQQQAAEKTMKARAKASTAVAPMTTENVGAVAAPRPARAAKTTRASRTPLAKAVKAAKK